MLFRGLLNKKMYIYKAEVRQEASPSTSAWTALQRYAVSSIFFTSNLKLGA